MSFETSNEQTPEISTDVQAGVARGGRPVTFAEAEVLGAFELAQQWADQVSWPVDRSAPDELAKLACMSALARWLIRWQPILIHRAILAGATLPDVVAALGASQGEAFRYWHSWATRQRHVIIGGKPGVTAAEYEVVKNAFAIPGTIAHSEGTRRG
jgi:hypothetical protein